MGKGEKRGQRQALKRKVREQRVREEKARRRTLLEGTGSRRAISRASDLPLAECVISKGWKERGLAHILVARHREDGKLTVAGFYVDTLCLGLKDAAAMPILSPEEYQDKVKPNVFNDDVEFEPCDPGVARAVVEGAIAFAEKFGFRPNKRWPEAKKLLEGFDPKPEGVLFGREGRPCLVLRNGQKNPVAEKRLEKFAGAGNYTVEEVGGS